MSPFNRANRGEIVPYPRDTSSSLRRIIWIAFIGFLLLAVVIFAGIHLLRPNSSSKGMRGVFMNAVAIPGPEGGYRLWILSDGSFHYILRRETPGSLSIGRKCKFCKTWTYVYDPVRKTVLAKFKTDYKSIIIQSWMTSLNGKIWVATDAYEQNEPRLFVYSAEPAGLVQETPEIIKNYPELKSGLIKIRMERDPDRFILDTRDGRVGLVLALSDEKLYANESEFKRTLARGNDEPATVFVLAREDSGPRRILYKATGPKSKIKESGVEFWINNPGALLSSSQATAERVAPGCVYIEGLIFHQDSDGCLILHQDAAGNAAHRLLTCIDAGGHEKWTAGPAELFKEMEVNLDKDPLSNIVFMKSKLDISRSGSLVMLQLRGVGIIGFDFGTGKKLWEIRF